MPDILMTKKCPRCECVKPLAEYYKDIHSRLGVTSYCKSCMSDIARSEDFKDKKRAYYANNRDRIRINHEKHRAKYKKSPKGKEWYSEYSKRTTYKYSTYRNRCKYRSIDFNITYEEFVTMYNTPCAYCGDLNDIMTIDRIDSSKGYSSGNVIPCCKMCNSMKSKFTKDDFINKCLKISLHQGIKI